MTFKVPELNDVHIALVDIGARGPADMLMNAAMAGLRLARFIRDHADSIEAGWPELTAEVDLILGSVTRT